LEPAFPAVDGRADARVGRQLLIQLRLVRVLQYVDHMGAAHPRRIVDTGTCKATALEFLDPLGTVVKHVLLAAEADGAGGAGLDAGRLLADGHPIDTQGTFVGLVVPLADARYIEGATGDTVAATDTVFGV